jgi:esterase
VFTKTYGEGERTFFGIHGWSGSHETFAPLAAHLPSGVRLISVDLPGHGRSEWSGGLDLEQLAGLLAAEMARVDAPVFSLIGNCSGALLGLAAIESQPALAARIERLVLIDPFAFLPWYFRIFVIPVAGKFFYQSTFANPLGRWLTNLSLRGKRSAETDLTHSFSRIDHQVSYRYLQLLAGIGSIERWSDICIETDIVHGARTFGAIRESVGRWRSLWPHIRIHELPGAGHLPILEAPAELGQIIFH